MKISESKRKQFQQKVWGFYRSEGRHELPWRQTADPYQILVSELMLQQTQVDRVIPKYEAFIKKWPTTKALSKVSLGEVLKAWQGLGYNRRAKYLHEAATYVENELIGKFPDTFLELQKLPGVGPYTAAAIAAFAYNQPVTLVETNVRQVVIFHFLKTASEVTETEILDVVAQTLPEKNYRDWYAALMDYGSYLKKEHGNLNRQSKSYTKQSVFKGSDREVRGAILRLLAKEDSTKTKIYKSFAFHPDKISEQLSKLETEGMVVRTRRTYSLP